MSFQLCLWGNLLVDLFTRQLNMAMQSLFSLELVSHWKVVRQRMWRLTDFMVVRKDIISIQIIPHRNHCLQHIITIVICSACCVKSPFSGGHTKRLDVVLFNKTRSCSAIRTVLLSANRTWCEGYDSLCEKFVPNI